MVEVECEERERERETERDRVRLGLLAPSAIDFIHSAALAGACCTTALFAL